MIDKFSVCVTTKGSQPEQIVAILSHAWYPEENILSVLLYPIKFMYVCNIKQRPLRVTGVS